MQLASDADNPQNTLTIRKVACDTGSDKLSPKDRMTMETAKSIREDYLHQDAFHEVDTYATLKKQCTMLKLILEAHDLALKAIPTISLIDLYSLSIIILLQK